jgi:hypothetical protein
MRCLYMPDRLWVDQPTISQWRVQEIVQRSCESHVQRARCRFVDVQHPACGVKVTRTCALVCPLISAREQANAISGIDAPSWPAAVPDARAVPSTCASSRFAAATNDSGVGLRISHVFAGGAVNLAWSIPSALRFTAAIPSIRWSRSSGACQSTRGRKPPDALDKVQASAAYRPEARVAFNRGRQCAEAFSLQTTFVPRSDGPPSPGRVALARANYNLKRQYEPWVHRRGAPRGVAY